MKKFEGKSCGFCGLEVEGGRAKKRFVNERDLFVCEDCIDVCARVLHGERKRAGQGASVVDFRPTLKRPVLVR